MVENVFSLFFLFIIFISDICQIKFGSLTQSSANDVALVHTSVPLPDACSLLPVQPHRVNLVHKGQGPILVGHLTHLPQRGDITYTKQDRFLVSNDSEIHSNKSHKVNLISSTFRDYTKILKFLLFFRHHNLNKFYNSFHQYNICTYHDECTVLGFREFTFKKYRYSFASNKNSPLKK